MRHLVLGSEGQIGSHLVQYLKQIKEEVLEFDILRSDEEDLRIKDNAKLILNLGQCDFVHFLAFDVGGSLYMSKFQDSYEFLSNNIKIMNNVFDLLKYNKKPFIFASSQMSNMNHSAYGRLKAIGENYTKALHGIIIKFWNVYGIEKSPEKTHVITDFIKKAQDEKKIQMRTNGLEERQFLYGDDAAECLYILSKNYQQLDRNRHLHITNFKWNSILDVAKIISKRFNNCPIIPNECEDIIQKGIKNQPDDYVRRFWQPKTELTDGINKVINLMFQY